MSDIVEKLRTPVYCDDLMGRWDRWRKQHKEGFAGSATRDEFESIIDGIDEERTEAADEIERLREADLINGEALAKMNRQLVELDARLAEAVEVVRFYRCDCHECCVVGDDDGPTCGRRATAFLAKVENASE